MDNEEMTGTTQQGQMELREAEDYLSKVLKELNPDMTQREHRIHMGAVLDTLSDVGMVSDEDRRILRYRYAR